MNDMLKNKVMAIVTIIFVAAATMLVSLAAILTINLTGALDTLMTKAKTPHFLQMHAGDLDEERLAAFAEQNSQVEAYQVKEFLNIDGSQIQLGDQTLADSVQDNGVSTQGEGFDYLLDLDGEVIQPADGELYVPIPYMKEKLINVGDKAVISGQDFTVAGFLRDSQMNSSLAASKRFLVSENDYAQLKDKGSLEYLIEFRLKDPSKLSEFETAYASAQLEANGPTVTYTLFKLMNALSDGIMIAIILFVSALVVAIAFICIRFTLLSKMEDDYCEIGVMKAIGMRIADIKRIYFAKYVAIAAVGSVLGFGLSVLLKDILLENIRMSMGQSENASAALLFGILGIVIVFVFILLYVNGVLRQFKKISVVEAIRFGTAQDAKPRTKRFQLHKNALLNTNVFLGIKDVLARKKLYVTMLAVIVVASFIMIVPQNLHHTISSKSFTQYMGIGAYDLRIDVQQTDDNASKTDEIVTAMEQDSELTNYTALTTKILKAKTENGTEENVKVELGDHSAFPIAYSQGEAPVHEHEIALSSINAEEMNKKVGDRITLVVAGQEKQLTVSGIYSDITNGGKTAKAVFTDESAAVMWSVVVAKLKDPTIVAEKVNEYGAQFSYAKVSDVSEFVKQTFGSTIDSVETAAYVAIAVSILNTILITVLFMKMLIAKDRPAIAVMKSLGFNNADMKVQYISRALFVLSIGIVVGTVLANTLGEMLAGAMIASFGANAFTFAIDPITAYIVCPLLMLVAVVIATIGGTAGAGRIQISQHIKG